MKIYNSKVIGLFVMLALFAASSHAQLRAAPRTLTISAAASLKDALNEIGRGFTKKRPLISLRFNFASSGTLQRQIEAGAPVDVFISAAARNVDELASAGLLLPETARVVARNVLVLVAPRQPPVAGRAVRSWRDLGRAGANRLAIGEPSSVPAGRYAEQVLRKLGLWQSVSPRAVRMKDVRAVLAAVESGNVDAGIVYRTDAATSRRVRFVAFAPPNSHSPITYPVAVVKASASPAQARDFVLYLASAPARSVLRRYKFLVP